ncbi:SDR family NAD(P)-dependent oxidoreductase [Nonomuraea sp. NPDC048892]|uniref:SDR family NAD(P)-dependent oxidoreductase n=1 Tax=Nonomuraea sp. NPDC048892 TaxID=3154624 RepID=UPI0033E27DE1
MGVRVSVVDPDVAGAPPPGSETGQAEIETCLRVMAQARAADPADPRWAAVHEAAAHLYRAGKKSRKASRHAERRRRDHEVTAATVRYREQDPSPALVPPAISAGPRDQAGPRAQAGPSDQAGVAEPDSSGDRAAPPRRSLVGTRRCYVCKSAYRQLHPEYHLLCPACADESMARRHARCDLRGRRAIVTGGRVKIGFQLALKLLRDGADVLVTTRFPRDAARRFAAVPDAGAWLDRLHVHGVDLLDLAAVAGLLESVQRRFSHLDILVNNAAQTIRRPAAYHREVRTAESVPLRGLAARIDVPERLEVAPVPSHPAVRQRDALEEWFPAGQTDETGQPLDLRDRNSWSLRLHEVDPAEWLEVQLVNSFAPFLLTSRLRALLEASPWPDRYVVQVSAMEGSFSREQKTVRHPHTNMAKAALNMLTRTAAADYAASGIYMNSVDTGWVTDERPHPDKIAQREAGFRPPLDVIDGAARVYDPIVRGVGGDRVSGLFLKDYRPVEW